MNVILHEIQFDHFDQSFPITFPLILNGWDVDVGTFTQLVDQVRPVIDEGLRCTHVLRCREAVATFFLAVLWLIFVIFIALVLPQESIEIFIASRCLWGLFSVAVTCVLIYLQLRRIQSNAERHSHVGALKVDEVLIKFKPSFESYGIGLAACETKDMCGFVSIIFYPLVDAESQDEIISVDE